MEKQLTRERLEKNTMLQGVHLRPLARRIDQRGSLTEIFQDHWGLGIEPVQWSVVESKAGVLRGLHLHMNHDEYFLLTSGKAGVGLYDIREDSTTVDQSAYFVFTGTDPTVLCFPRGLLHGWYFYEDSTHLQCVSESYRDYHPSDNLGCHWSDPALGIPWPAKTPLIAPRADAFPSLDELRRTIHGA